MAGEYTSMAATTGNPYAIAAGVTLDLINANRNAKALKKYNRQVRNNEVIKLAFKNRQLNRNQQELEAVASHEKLEIQKRTLESASRAQTSAGESGVGGKGIDRIVGNILSKGSSSFRNINRNVESSSSQLLINKKANQQGTQMLIDQLAQADSADFFAPLLQGGLALATS